VANKLLVFRKPFHWTNFQSMLRCLQLNRFYLRPLFSITRKTFVRQTACKTFKFFSTFEKYTSHFSPSLQRTHMCGQLTKQHVQQKVTLCGWVEFMREAGEQLYFIVLRDVSGSTQLVIDDAKCLL
jgi:lysyl-tRNA synthetase class II